MKYPILGGLLALTCAVMSPAPASACGGFFCSASPVDQNAERIVFAVDEATDTTDMIVQISYQGADDAFAWVLPVGSVPDKRQVFPAIALSSFDAQTAPTFVPPSECQGTLAVGGADGGASRAAVDDSAEEESDVTVHVMETVDVYDVAVIQSASSEATFRWLLDNGYRLSTVMKPYIEHYTAQQMMFLALKLTADASVKDLKPFKMTLPGSTPTIPLRLTAIAAEPEMSVLVWVLGSRRYEPANADEIAIAKEELRWDGSRFPVRTNWAQLVARKVDQRGGRGWVVEQAGSTTQLADLAANSFASTPEQKQAQQALVGLLKGRPYLTRLYTRVAAEEMSYDPTFRRSDKADVPRQHDLPFIEEICSRDAGRGTIDPCDFAACGPLGLCRAVKDPRTEQQTASCACAPGTSARTTFDPQGAAMVTCQDQRMSFMNPGERDESGVMFADPCVGFSCGEHGQCIAMNLTPTCACDSGYVAIGRVTGDGTGGVTRQTECVLPTQAVPKAFYNRRPPELAEGMVAGRTVALSAASGQPDLPMPDHYGEPMPSKPVKVDGKGDSSGCSAAGTATSRGATTLAFLFALGGLLARRRRARA